MRRSVCILIVVLAVAAAATLVASESARATYPGANGRLAFGINLAGNTDVYSVLPNGEALRRLTDDPGFDACAAYSADGTQIAYCSGQGDAPGQFDIWTMKQNGTQKQRLTQLGGRATFPDFSPDGTQIGFGAQPAAFRRGRRMERRSSSRAPARASTRSG